MALLPFTAGPISLLFDTDSAFLRYVRLGDQEIVRGVFAAVRDADWNTVPFSIDGLEIEKSDDGFSLTYNARCVHQEIQFQWKGGLTGNADGTIEYLFQGESQNSFLRNRIGLCVLHPLRECVGQRCRVEHVDGSVIHGEFPRWISPHQPFQEIRSLTHSVLKGAEARVTMLGDTFEMEDQRNWTDASFKTYCTPLELPFPVPVNAGDTVEQSIKIELLKRPKEESTVPCDESGEGNGGGIGDSRPTWPPHRIVISKEHAIEHPDEISVTVDWAHPHPRPKMGFLYPDFSEPPIQTVIDRLCEIQPDHLRVDLWYGRDSWRSTLKAAAELAQQIGSELEIAVFTEEITTEFLREFRTCLEPSAVQIARWLIFHPLEKTTPHSLHQSAQNVLKEHDVSIPLAVGTNAYFAELNRDRPQEMGDSLACYSINPQVHAFDNRSLCETFEAQRSTVDSTVNYLGTDVVISPITLRPRFNPNATSQNTGLAGLKKELEAAIDPRQSSPFAAAWTSGVLSSVATHPRVRSLTLFEAFGPRGVVRTGGEKIPLAEVLQFAINSTHVFDAACSRPLDVVAFGALQPDGQKSIVLANPSDQPQHVKLSNANLNVQKGLQKGARNDANRVQIEAESVLFLSVEEGADA